MAKYCESCGRENSDIDKFCINCGNPLKASSDSYTENSAHGSDFPSDYSSQPSSASPYSGYSSEQSPYSSGQSYSAPQQSYSSGQQSSYSSNYSSPYPVTGSSAGRPNYSSGYPGTVPNYLVHSIVATVLCCPIFGGIGIFYAAQVNTKLAQGDYEAALVASNNAKMWSYIAFFAAAAIQIIPLLFSLIGGLLGSY